MNEGTVKAGEHWPGYCCDGYDFEIILGESEYTVAALGLCYNPDCPKWGDNRDYSPPVSWVDASDRPEAALKEGE